MHKEKVLVYPYGKEFAPIIRHRGLLSQYEFVALISPTGWGLVGKDAGCADGGSEIGIPVSDDYDAELDNCDTVIIADCLPGNKFKRRIHEKINEAIEREKNIVCMLDLDEDDISRMKAFCLERDVYFKYLRQAEDLTNIAILNYDGHTEEYMDDITIPVVFIAGLLEDTNKFEIQLSVRESLLEEGYKVSQIGTRGYCDIFGFHSFPDFMYSTGIPEANKVILFNKFIKHIERNEDPDIIIVGLPGAIMPLNRQFTNKFGILAYLASQAVRPDFSIISVFYDEVETKFFEMIRISIRYKFGFETDCFNISNTFIDFEDSKQSNKIVTSYLESHFVDAVKSRYADSKTPIYNVLNEIDRKEISRALIDSLSGYSYNEQFSIGRIYYG